MAWGCRESAAAPEAGPEAASPRCRAAGPVAADMRHMKLYLSSYKLGEDTSMLRREAGDGRALMIFNALDYFGEGVEGRLLNFERWVEKLNHIGYSRVEE